MENDTLYNHNKYSTLHKSFLSMTMTKFLRYFIRTLDVAKPLKSDITKEILSKPESKEHFLDQLFDYLDNEKRNRGEINVEIDGIDHKFTTVE